VVCVWCVCGVCVVCVWCVCVVVCVCVCVCMCVCMCVCVFVSPRSWGEPCQKTHREQQTHPHFWPPAPAASLRLCTHLCVCVWVCVCVCVCVWYDSFICVTWPIYTLSAQVKVVKYRRQSSNESRLISSTILVDIHQKRVMKSTFIRWGSSDIIDNHHRQSSDESR